MNILITGSRGFVGKNLMESLKAVRDGKDSTRGLPTDLTIWECTRQTTAAELADFCAKADFVYHLAGVNRPENPAEFMIGNGGFTAAMLETLKKAGNTCPVVIASSTQAEVDNPYGLSKRAEEAAAFTHAGETGARVLVYRFPNLFGKWCRPNYNSVVATFCHNISRDLPITLSDPDAQLTLCYIDDAVDELLLALQGKEHRAGDFCAVPVVYQKRLGQIAKLLYSFHDSRKSLAVPDLGDDFIKKLYATYLSYLPENGFAYPLTAHGDARGSFTEILRTEDRGQFSVNVSKPGITKGNHWHHTKNEKFLVVSGTGRICFRKIGGTEVTEYRVCGENPAVVDIPTGYTHSIVNDGEGDLVTFMWASECFDPAKPDTFFEEV